MAFKNQSGYLNKQGLFDQVGTSYIPVKSCVTRLFFAHTKFMQHVASQFLMGISLPKWIQNCKEWNKKKRFSGEKGIDGGQWHMF